MQVLHTVVLPDLEPDTEYYFECGDGITFSPPLTFRSLKAAGADYPQRLLLIADWGLSYNCEPTAVSPNLTPDRVLKDPSSGFLPATENLLARCIATASR